MVSSEGMCPVLSSWLRPRTPKLLLSLFLGLLQGLDNCFLWPWIVTAQGAVTIPSCFKGKPCVEDMAFTQPDAKPLAKGQ